MQFTIFIFNMITQGFDVDINLACCDFIYIAFRMTTKIPMFVKVSSIITLYVYFYESVIISIAFI